MSQEYYRLITSADPNSAYSSRRSFPVSKFGYIPKSDTFQYLTVSDKFNEKRDKPNVYEIANQAFVSPTETLEIYVPSQSIIVKFHLYEHKQELLGTYQICLPKALPGLKIKVIFTANPKMIGYPTTVPEPFKGSGWPKVMTDPQDDAYENTEYYRIKVNTQKINVKCNDTDLFRGICLNPNETSLGFLPFSLGESMTLEVKTDTTMEQILSSHAELECIVAGEWTAKFYGLWENSIV